MSDADGTTLLFMMNCDSSNGEGGRAITTTFPAGSYLYQYARRVSRQRRHDDELLLHRAVERAGERPRHSEGRLLRVFLAFARDAQRERQHARHLHPAKRRGSRDAHVPAQGWPGRRPGVQSLRAARHEHDRLRLLLHRAAYHRRLEPLVPRPRRRFGGEHRDGTRRRASTSTRKWVWVRNRGDLRDHPPALSTDVFLGYEQMQFVQRTAEKFAAEDTSRNIIGSVGAETYQATNWHGGFHGHQWQRHKFQHEHGDLRLP